MDRAEVLWMPRSSTCMHSSCHVVNRESSAQRRGPKRVSRLPSCSDVPANSYYLETLWPSMPWRSWGRYQICWSVAASPRFR